jgi:protein-S-isoprenylcysteine O-methyltransferase Ste14
MSRIAKFFLLVVAPIMALLLAWLGIKTLPTNPSGWFLILVGVAYTAGVVIVYAIRKKRFWESPLQGVPTHEERGDRSLWFIVVGMIAVFYLSPLEYLYLPASLPRTPWMGKNYSGHVSVKSGQTLVQSGPYRLIRHPAYAGYMLMAVGISLGYSSLAGLASILVLLLPGLIYRMKVEERLLTQYFGEAYRQYAVKVKRIIPGIW